VRRWSRCSSSPDLWLPCEECGGTRFAPEVLEVRYRGKSIADVLELSVDAALEFLTAHPRAVSILKTLKDVGLGYMSLGQSSTTLSGGEAQRVKLASELFPGELRRLRGDRARRAFHRVARVRRRAPRPVCSGALPTKATPWS
jgi:excinuclease UvrABC ATPase subunit